MKESYTTTTRLKSGESLPGNAATDFVKDSSGDIHVATPAGAKKMVTEANINTVLAAAGGPLIDVEMNFQ